METSKTSPCAMGRLCVGQAVTVLRMGLSTPPFIEGRATIVRTARRAHHYIVRFDDDPASYERVVRPEFQHDPEGVLQALLDLWRAERRIGASISEFFPDDLPAWR